MDEAEIYRHHASRYDALARARDCDQHLIEAIEELIELRGARVLEVGAGTGAVTHLLLQRGAEVRAFDREASMLLVAREYLGRVDPRRWQLREADARELPVEDGWADAAIAGWVFGHFRYWMPDRWRDEIGRGVDELVRAVRPGGVAIVVETLGTGEASPCAPSTALGQYYDWLEQERGFRCKRISTDYQFDSVAEAAEVTGFFFGDFMEKRVRSRGWKRVPEFAGVWWHRKPRPSSVPPGR